MRPQPRPARSAPPSLLLLLLALTLVLAPGCEEPRHVKTKPSESPAATPAPEAEAAAAPAPDVVQPREIVGQKTTDIRNTAEELNKGAQVAETKITAKDYITLQGNAYVTIVGRTSVLQIEQAMNLYKAANDRYPKDFAEFKAEIIQANNIALPQLPYYQEYSYDENTHKLIVLEYPARKAAVK